MSTPTTIPGVLVYFSATLGWSGSKKNKEKTKEICDHDNASEDAGSWSDRLFPSKACGKKNAYTELRKHLGQMRNFTYDNTFVFEDSLWRILPEKRTEAYRQLVEVDGRQRALELLEQLIIKLPELMQAAALPKPKGRGDGYRAEDYPTSTQIRELFRYSVDYRPIPTGATLNPALFQDAIDKLNALNAQRMAEAQETLIRRFLEPLHTLSQQLLDPEKKKIKTVLESILEISELVPSLDLAGNSQLVEFANDIHNTFSSVTPELLKTDEQMRKMVQNTCSQFVTALGSFGAVGARKFA